MQTADNPIVALNHPVAVAMARGPQAGLDLVADFHSVNRIAEDHRFHSVRAHLLEMAGQPSAARHAYLAAERATNLVERHLYLQAARITDAL